MGLIIYFWDVKGYLICLKKYFFKNSIFFISVKISNYSFTKFIEFSSLYVLIGGDSEYVTYIFR